MVNRQEALEQIVRDKLRLFSYRASDACIASIVSDIQDYYEDDVELANKYRDLEY